MNPGPQVVEATTLPCSPQTFYKLYAASLLISCLLLCSKALLSCTRLRVSSSHSISCSRCTLFDASQWRQNQTIGLTKFTATRSSISISLRGIDRSNEWTNKQHLHLPTQFPFSEPATFLSSFWTIFGTDFFVLFFPLSLSL